MRRERGDKATESRSWSRGSERRLEKRGRVDERRYREETRWRGDKMERR